MTKNPNFPGVSHLGKASAEMASMVKDDNKARLIDLINQAYFPEDITQLKSRRYKPMHTGLITSQMAFIGDRIIETNLRSLYLIAQMIKDGTYNAHSVGSRVDSNGNTIYFLQYNESQDKRFSGNKAYKNAIKQGLADKGEGIDKNGRMTLAYDWRLRQRMRDFSDTMLPSADKDKQSHAKRFAILAGAAQMKSWITEFYSKATSREYSHLNSGDYLAVPGSDTLVWTNSPYKGLWTSYLDLPRYIHDSIVEKRVTNWNEISEQDKRNYIFSLNSLMYAAVIAFAGARMFGDEDDEDYKTLEYMYARALSDAIVPMTLSPIWSLFSDPLIFVSYFKRLFNVVGRAFAHGTDGDFQASWDDLKKVTPVVKDVQF